MHFTKVSKLQVRQIEYSGCKNKQTQFVHSFRLQYQIVTTRVVIKSPPSRAIFFRTAFRFVKIGFITIIFFDTFTTWLLDCQKFRRCELWGTYIVQNPLFCAFIVLKRMKNIQTISKF